MLTTLAPPNYGHLARLGIARDATTLYETRENYDPLVDGISKQTTEKTKWDSPSYGHNGLKEKYRQQIQKLTSSGQKGFRTEKSNAEAFISRGPDADVKETRCQRVAEARSADGQWSFSSTSTSTSTFVVTKGFGNGMIRKRRSVLGPTITEMDLDTIESTPNLDHTHQKGKSELVQKGSLGHRRPPTRAGLKSFVSSVWDHTLEERSISGSSDSNHNDSNHDNVEIEEKHTTTESDDYVTSTSTKEHYVVEVNDSVDDVHSSDGIRDEPEGREDLIGNEADIPKDGGDEDTTRGWKHPPKHAVLVFPMQLLNNAPASRAKSPVTSDESSWNSSNRNNEGVGEEDEMTRNSSSTFKSTTVRVTSESASSSSDSEDHENLMKPYAERRCSAPTVVSITLKDPLGARIGPARSTDDFSSNDSKVSSHHSPTVISFGKLNAPPKPQRHDGPTQILIRPFSTCSIDDKADDVPSKDRDSTFITEYNPHRLRRESDEKHSRSAAVQVRISNKKTSPTRKPLRDSSSSPERNPDDLPRCRKIGTSVSPGITVNSPSVKPARSTPARSNTVVFIKPNHPPPPPPTQSSHVSRSMSTREAMHSSMIDFTSREEFKAKDVSSHEDKLNLSPKLKDRCSSVSSLDVSSTKSNDSSKEESVTGSPSKPNRRDPNFRQRVQIQTWDRRSQHSASPSPSRSKIRELVMSPPRKPSPQGRPASDCETDRIGNRNRSNQDHADEISVSSRRSSPSGHRYSPSPNLNKRGENKPEWLKKIDLDRRKVIDWDNIGIKRQSQDNFEPVSLQNWPTDRTKETPASFQYQAVPECTSLKTEVEERVIPVRKDTPIPRYNQQPAQSRPKTSGTIKEEPEWIRIAEKKRNSSINWNEISALRTPTEKAKEKEPTIHEETSNNIGVQVKLRKPKPDHESKTKPPEDTLKNHHVEPASRIPRTTVVSKEQTTSTSTSTSKSTDEAHVIQNILSKVRASRREESPESDLLPEVKVERGRSSSKSELLNYNKRRSQSTGHSRPSWTEHNEKEIIIEDLPRESTKKRPSSPVLLRSTHRRKDVDRPLSMMELNNIRQEPFPKSHGSTRPPTSGGYGESRSSRNQPVESHRNRHSKNREYRRSASYDRNLHVMTSTSGSDQDEERTDSTSDTQTGKKKVRFLIKQEPTKTYTMFGMEPPKDVDENEKPKTTESTVAMDEDDYQLQAYKIINRIKSMSKSREPSPERNTNTQRSSSQQRSSLEENTPPRISTSSKQHRKNRNASPDSGTLTRSSKDSLPRSSRKHSGSKSNSNSRRTESPSPPENKRKETKRSDSTRSRTKSPDWTKKSSSSKKTSVDWDSLDRGSNDASSNRPVWAEFKLKRTPYSTQFLSYQSDVEDQSDAEQGGERVDNPESNGQCHYGDNYEQNDGVMDVPNGHCMSLDALVEKDNEEMSLVAEKKLLYNGDAGYYASVTNGHTGGESKINNTQSNGTKRSTTQNNSNKYHSLKSDKSHLPSLMDSEGYSSMESFSCCKAQTNSICHCSNCSQHSENGSESLSTPVVINTIKKQNGSGELKSSLKKREEHRDIVDDDEGEFVVHHFGGQGGTKDYHWNELDATEPTLPPPPPLSLRLSGGSDTEYHRDNVHYVTDDERKSAKPKRCVSMRVDREYMEDKGKRSTANRRNSLLESRKKLMDILGTIEDKSSKRGPQVKTIRKTIRRILRGSDVTDEEEEIVEEITEEVFGLPGDKSDRMLSDNGGSDSKRATITRTVHQTKDGQKFLTTTMVNGSRDRSDMRNGTHSMPHSSVTVQREPAIVRVTTKRIR